MAVEQQELVSLLSEYHLFRCCISSGVVPPSVMHSLRCCTLRYSPPWYCTVSYGYCASGYCISSGVRHLAVMPP